MVDGRAEVGADHKLRKALVEISIAERWFSTNTKATNKFAAVSLNEALGVT